jgi:hypothetical protein
MAACPEMAWRPPFAEDTAPDGRLDGPSPAPYNTARWRGGRTPGETGGGATMGGPHRLGQAARWVGRVLGALIGGLFLAFFVGETLSSPGGLGGLRLTLAEAVEVAAVVTALVGIVVGWRREALGGALSVAGGLAFIAAESVDDGAMRLVWFPLVFVVVGALYLLGKHLTSPAPERP